MSSNEKELIESFRERVKEETRLTRIRIETDEKLRSQHNKIQFLIKTNKRRKKINFDLNRENQLLKDTLGQTVRRLLLLEERIIKLEQ